MATKTKKTAVEQPQDQAQETRPGWHRHQNGGGWVQDTAAVDKAAWVGTFGLVHGNCWIGPKARIMGGTIMGGDIWGGTIKTSPLQIQGSRYYLLETHEGKVQIGCTELTVAEWRDKGESLAAQNSMTPDEVEEYRAYLDLFERVMAGRQTVVAIAETSSAAEGEGA